jgi:hypothetical protein
MKELPFYSMQYAFEIQALFSSCGMKKTFLWLSTAHCGSYGYDSSRLALARQPRREYACTIPFPFMLDD